MAPPYGPLPMFFRSATLPFISSRYPCHSGRRQTWSCSFADSATNTSATATPSSFAKRHGTSVPSATRPAPVSVAQSTSKSGASLQASTSASASTRRPSASVLPISVVLPFLATRTSPGRNASPEIAFSTAGTRTRKRTGSCASMTIAARPSTCAAPPMSFFIVSIAAAGLMSRPPVSKQTPLPTSVTFGASSDPQVRSIRRGCCFGPAARPTAWIWG
mmetsp:Transcript_24391/g.68634  ORF Transcript_24391/g.68634 Transcript_24391/m.68634 type:complete len:218 (-) Transcript_24391:863-1516(-)